MSRISWELIVFSILLLGNLTSCASNPEQVDPALPIAEPTPPQDWIDDFNLPARKLASTGRSRFFILMPGSQSVLASGESKLTITVLNQTKNIGGVTTRVVEEREEDHGLLAEVSRNFYAIDNSTGDVFYFGEEVDLYSNGQLTAHRGAWIADENGSRPGLIMPGTPSAGMKYYQELAPGVAMDRARVVSLSESISTKAGDFEGCLLTQESSQIEAGAIEYKTYCPGVGLVQDESMTLVSISP